MPGAPDSVLKLVDRFELHREDYRRGRYNETQVRVELIDDLYSGICPQILGDDAGKVLGWLRRPEEDFVRLPSKAVTRQLSSAAIAELAAFRRLAGGELGRFLTEQLRPEKQLATLVEDAYGLTPEERQFLRDTRRARDPIDVLEPKLAGLDAENEAERGHDDG